ncbi:phospholipase D1/2 [Sulfitobacter undariae]|uniref:Phospholipase D n=1 Tax=Sulfitobacter undariae TaxID=1563671 RepID=A0A7W6E7S9_9RHOB|nr:phospholipase D-like domain-containing protein [Sulfitobacter undariae]MBB3992819.1 phospholipase D1/2 [Sulfitobacter undariae]
MNVTSDTTVPKADFFKPDVNCWRVETADKFSFIIDGADYFASLRKIISNCEKQLMLIGWDFDLEIEMLPGESDENGCVADGLPNKLGPFLEAVVARSPQLQVYLLKWNGAVVVAPGRIVPSVALSMFGSDRIHFALDGHHPFGACHHQKIVVADDTFAFCGGIDATENRWDTSEHLPDDPRRVCKDGSLAQPWHDATSAMTGPAASALSELSRLRWQRATGETLERPSTAGTALWPEELEVQAHDVKIAIARTEPPYDGAPLINEIERLYLDSIEAANDVIYLESQYFTAQTICDALQKRLEEENGPEVVIINPKSAQSDFEDDAMHVLRNRMIEQLREVDHENRFRIYYPVNTAEEPIYVHAKIMIVDTSIIRLGSSNLNDRSMGFDTECDVALTDADSLIAETRAKLVSEHLGVTPQVFSETFARERSLIATISALSTGKMRGLRKLRRRRENWRGLLLARTRLMDKRYRHDDDTSAGNGIRPRHLAVIGAGAMIGYIGFMAWRWFEGNH